MAGRIIILKISISFLFIRDFVNTFKTQDSPLASVVEGIQRFSISGFLAPKFASRQWYKPDHNFLNSDFGIEMDSSRHYQLISV